MRLWPRCEIHKCCQWCAWPPLAVLFGPALVILIFVFGTLRYEIYYRISWNLKIYVFFIIIMVLRLNEVLFLLQKLQRMAILDDYHSDAVSLQIILYYIFVCYLFIIVNSLILIIIIWLKNRLPGWYFTLPTTSGTRGHVLSTNQSVCGA